MGECQGSHTLMALEVLESFVFVNDPLQQRDGSRPGGGAMMSVSCL